MPSTPRMIELERKASTPGEGLSRDEVSEWHDELELMSDDEPTLYMTTIFERPLDGTELFYAPPTRTAANRYLDSPAWKAQ